MERQNASIEDELEFDGDDFDPDFYTEHMSDVPVLIYSEGDDENDDSPYLREYDADMDVILEDFLDSLDAPEELEDELEEVE